MPPYVIPNSPPNPPPNPMGGTTITPVFPFPGGNHAQSNPVIPMNIFVNVPPP